jgi:hypothetical protein
VTEEVAIPRRAFLARFGVKDLPGEAEMMCLVTGASLPFRNGSENKEWLSSGLRRGNE